MKCSLSKVVTNINMLVPILVCVLVTQAYAEFLPPPVFTISQGRIRGKVASDGDYYAYLGIPYAGSPEGEHRFRPPIPAPRFGIDEIFEAFDGSVRCPQPSPEGPIGEENCLNLHIFSKNISIFSNQPVLVWLIGEEYTTSNPLEHSFKNLVEQDLVVVAVNYRLSVLGFLCLGIADAPGNAGLKDVIQALEWIHRDIDRFGGDPNNVMLFGHGSAAAMVDLVTMSPLAENLVHKVIVHSGSAIAPWAVSFNPVGSARTYATQLGFNGTDRQEIVDYLNSVNVHTLIDNLSRFEFQDNTYLFAPCVESEDLDPDNRFLTDAPINLLRSGNYNHVSFITGYTDREGTIRIAQAVNGQWLQQMQNNFTNFLPADLYLDANLTQLIRQHYFGQGQINMNSIQAYMDYHGDTMIIVPVIRGAIERARTSRGEVRVLEFTYNSTNNQKWLFPGIQMTGVHHGGILNFILNISMSEWDERVSTSIVDRYVSFAYTGVPTLPNTVTWLPMNRVRYYVNYSGGMIIDNRPDFWHWKFSQWLTQNPSQAEMVFWEDIYSNHSIAPTPVSSAETTAGSSLIAVLLFSLMMNVL